MSTTEESRLMGKYRTPDEFVTLESQWDRDRAYRSLYEGVLYQRRGLEAMVKRAEKAQIACNGYELERTIARIAALLKED